MESSAKPIDTMVPEDRIDTSTRTKSTKAYSDTDTAETYTTRSTTRSSDYSTRPSAAGGGALVPLNFSRIELVGRSKERATLLETFERIRAEKNSAPEIVLVRGESGCGKSALVQSIEGEVESKGGFFASGKYGQFDASQRYLGGLVDAVTELAYLVAESKFAGDIRERIKEALSAGEISALARIMPCVRLVITGASEGPNASLISSSCDHQSGLTTDEHAFHNFCVLFRSFLDAISKPSHPIVLHLDDLQWTDDASKRLLETLASSCSKLSNVLLIGTVRQDDKDTYDLPPRQEGLAIATISLNVLKEEDINMMVAAATERRPEDTKMLTSTVFRKTMGNPFFCLQYLEMLHREGFLRFSWTLTTWEWDIEEIQSRTNVSENVVEVLIGKISAQPREVQILLMVASMLGFDFDPDILYGLMTSNAILDVLGEDSKWGETSELFRLAHDIEAGEDADLEVRKKSRQNMMFTGLLKKATGAGLLDEPPAHNTKYKFSHDRVRHSVHLMSPRGTLGANLGYVIGEALLHLSQSFPAEEWMLFASVDLMLTKRSMLKKRSAYKNHQGDVSDEANQMANLCLQAARRASNQSIFISAANYADQGIALIPPVRRWKDHYDLCAELFQLSAEMHYSYGNFEKSKVSVSEIITNSRCLIELTRAYSLSIATKGAQCDLKGGLREGAFLLKELGFKVPAKPNLLQVNWFMLKGMRMLKKRTASDLLELPLMTDPVLIETTKVLHKLSVYDWRAGETNLLVIHTVIMLQLTLEHGIGSFGPYAFSLWGACLAHGGLFEEACEYGHLTLELLKRRPETQECYASSVKVVHLIFYHLKKPLYDSLRAMLDAYEIAKKCGNIEIAAYCLQAHAMFGVVVGMALDDLIFEMQGYCDFCHEFNQEAVLMEILPFLQLSMNLMGRSENPVVLSGEAMREEEFLHRLDVMNEGSVAKIMMTYAKIMLLYLFGELHLADAERRKVTQKRDTISTYYMKYLNYFFSAMTCLGLAHKERKRYYRRQAKFYVDKLREYAALGSVNSVPLLKLVEAEQKSLNPRNSDAEKDYQAAISMAGRCGYRLVKAMACERAGAYMLDRDRASAAHYLQDAVEELTEYGAFGKVQQMKEKYKGIIQRTSKRESELLSNARISSNTLRPFVVEKWNVRSSIPSALEN
jgi:predicted ATPase